jgi:ubiquinone/menaquinone biosynthesis C-methylase UbiE
MELQMLAAGQYAWTGEADPVRYYRLPIIGRLFQRRVARCIQLLPQGKTVLEVGYGSGVSFLNLARRFEEIHGIDLHDRGERVAESFAQTPVRLRLRRGDITSLPYEDESFDAALAVSIHEEIAPEVQEAAFSEIRRVLRPGGCYVVGVPGVNVLMNSALSLLGCDVAKYHVTTDSQVLAAMAARFAIDVVQYRPFWWPRSLTTYVCIRGWKR